MRLLTCDFSGHPFQVQLSRELAKRGHEVVHVYCPDYRSGQGDLTSRVTDPPTFRVQPISLGGTFEKSRYTRRAGQEIRFGWALRRLLKDHRPDVFISCNEPFLAKTVIGLWCKGRRQSWVFWLQDLYSVAMARELEAGLGPLGRVAGRAMMSLEAWLLASADHIVAISPAFVEWMSDRGLDCQNSTVIPNWAPLDELPYFEKDPGWFASVGLPQGAPVVLYSGTLGRKHNAELILAIANRVAESGAHVVVISEGVAAAQLERRGSRLHNLHVLPFQPWDKFAAVLGSAAVLLVVLEPAASKFSVPSKVLTYLCAGRVIVAAISADNLAAKVVESSGAGIVVTPDAPGAIAAAVSHVLSDPIDRERRGRAARAYAEGHFQIEPIADQWEERLRAVVSLDHKEPNGLD